MNKKEIITALSEKYRVSEKQVKQAVDSQFKFLANAMAEEKLPEIRIPYFGIFKPNEYQVKKLNEKKNKENNDKSN